MMFTLYVGYTGLLGLGPNTGSKVRKSVGDNSGDTVMNRIFRSTPVNVHFLSERLIELSITDR